MHAHVSHSHILEPKQTLPTQVGTYPQPLIFSKGMNNEQLALWLTNHPSLIGTDYQEDIEKLKGMRCLLAKCRHVTIPWTITQSQVPKLMDMDFLA